MEESQTALAAFCCIIVPACLSNAMLRGKSGGGLICTSPGRSVQCAGAQTYDSSADCVALINRVGRSVYAVCKDVEATPDACFLQTLQGLQGLYL